MNPFATLHNSRLAKRPPGFRSKVPGGMRKPYVSQHLEIVSFDATTRIMCTLCNPKCIALRSNDEREHKWLNKANEALRMDERTLRRRWAYASAAARL